MPAKRISTQVLELRGAFKKNPARALARLGEPLPNGELGDPPPHLSEAERACWNELVDIAPDGVLCRADRLIVEHGARILAALRADDVVANRALLSRFEAVLARLGLTPADRNRVSVKPPEVDDADDPWARLAAEG